MTLLLIGLLLFFTAHSISMVNQPWRDRMAARLGLQLWQGLYSLVALAGFLCLIWGYGLARAEPVPVYLPPVWLRHLSLLLLLPVFPLLFATYLPGRVQRAVRHPTLVATLLWATAHLLANGMLADLLLFGAFLLWASLELISLRRRTPAPVQGAPESVHNDIIALVGGIGLYLLFLFLLHAWLFGVSPLGV
jgi:uncharacterized membrane protein